MRIVNHLHANFHANRQWQTSFYYGLKYVRENFDGDRYELAAWCVMPNHVHVIVIVEGTSDSPTNPPDGGEPLTPTVCGDH